MYCDQAASRPRRYQSVKAMSLPPPSTAPGTREYVVALEASRSWRRRRAGEDSLTLSPLGAVFEHDRALRAPLTLPLGTLRLGLVDRGPARAGSLEGRFPILKRLSSNTVVPREQGIEGWLWTGQGPSALTLLCDADVAPNAAVLFTKPLGEDVIAAFEPQVAEEIAARSPLGAPAIYGFLLRVADPTHAENVFRRFNLLRPLTDREVAPTLRRHLPTDRPADPTLSVGDDRRAATSVAPPGM
jgi:hypothetical protein